MRPDNYILVIVGSISLLCTIPFWKKWWKAQGLDQPGSEFRFLTDCLAPSFKTPGTILGIGLAFILLGAIPIIRDLLSGP